MVTPKHVSDPQGKERGGPALGGDVLAPQIAPANVNRNSDTFSVKKNEKSVSEKQSFVQKNEPNAWATGPPQLCIPKTNGNPHFPPQAKLVGPHERSSALSPGPPKRGGYQEGGGQVGGGG